MNAHINTVLTRAHSALGRTAARCWLRLHAAKDKLRENAGQFVMDHTVVFVIIIVLGGVSLLLLRNYLQDDLSNTLETKINEFFN